jgi:hypothetical protein
VREPHALARERALDRALDVAIERIGLVAARGEEPRPQRARVADEQPAPARGSANIGRPIEPVSNSCTRSSPASASASFTRSA